MNYWQKRQQQLNSSMEKDEAALKKRLSRVYDSEARKLENQIAAYYQQYGENNVIQYRALLETLSDADRRLLIEQMDKFADKYPQYRDLMPVRESIYKLNRLEGLQYSVKMQQLEIGAIDNDQIRTHLERQAMRGANSAAEAMGFGKNFYASNPDIVKQFVDVPWADGENFSARIWKNTDKLANYLNTDIAQGFARGEPYQKLVSQLRDRFLRVSRNDAYRLIYTEGTYVMAEATMQPFVNDFDEYRLSTVGDGKVCDICRGVSTQVFKIKDRQPGTNFPPLHTWCRCTFEIVVSDWAKWMADYEARYGNGQAGKVVERVAGFKASQESKTFAKDAEPGIMNLSEKELGAILKYKSSESYVINDALRRTKNVGSLTLEQQEFVSILDAALAKVETFEGNLVRTVNFSDWPDCTERTNRFMEEFTPNKIVKVKQYWSTSRKYGHDDKAGIRIFIQDSKKGRDISKIGLDENEVLYERDNEFFVVAKKYAKGIWNVLLREV